MALFYQQGKSYSRFVRKNSPAIDLDIVNRFHAGIGRHPTVVYDGPTHTGYMITSRAWENWYCKTRPGRDLPICNDFLPNWFDPKYHSYDTEVKQLPNKGRSLVATKDIPKGTFINPHDAAMSWRLEQDLLDALVKFVDDYPEATMYRNVLDFLMAYGFTQQGIGIQGLAVSLACTNTFVNHACSQGEENVNGLMSAEVTEDPGDEATFSPPCARRPEIVEQLLVASRDIKAGEEILQDYSSFRVESDEDFKSFLKKMCDTGTGLVSG